jgi:hypothetical protein
MMLVLQSPDFACFDQPASLHLRATKTQHDHAADSGRIDDMVRRELTKALVPIATQMPAFGQQWPFDSYRSECRRVV